MLANTILAFPTMQQQEDHWCWAAVATGVNNFYTPAAPCTQCSIVCKCLEQPGCCQNPSSGLCNQDYYLDAALTAVGHLGGDPTPGPLDYASLAAELNNGHPVAVYIEWNDSAHAGHFVVVDGYCPNDNGQQMVDVQDPWNGHWYGTYDVFCNQYLGRAKWSYSYRTQ